MRSRLLFVALLAFVGTLHAQTPQKLRVGIFDCPPFAMKNAAGKWDGLAVNVWEKTCAQLKQPFEYVELPEAEAFDEVAAGRVDVLMGETAISMERAQRVRFSQPFAVFPESVALQRNARFPVLHYLAQVMQHGVGSILLIMLATMLLFSFLLWIVERKANHAHFGGHPVHGFGSAIWFAAVTMTTVGYGDKTPRTASGRVLVFFWMFFGVVAISAFTGTVASSMAVTHLSQAVISAEDLSRYKNGVLQNSLSQSVLSEIGIPATAYPSVPAGLHALENGEITAFIGNEATLRYLANRDFPGRITVTPIPDTHINYAFAMRPGLRDTSAIDAALIHQVARPEWRREEQRYLGPAAR